VTIKGYAIVIEGDPTGADDEITDLRLMRKSGRYKGAYRNLYTEIGDLVRLRARQRTPVYASLQGSLQRDPNNFQHLEHRDCSIRVCTNREYGSQRIRVNGRRSWKDFNETNADHAVAQNTLGTFHTQQRLHIATAKILKRVCPTLKTGALWTVIGLDHGSAPADVHRREWRNEASDGSEIVTVDEYPLILNWAFTGHGKR